MSPFVLMELKESVLFKIFDYWILTVIQRYVVFSVDHAIGGSISECTIKQNAKILQKRQK